MRLPLLPLLVLGGAVAAGARGQDPAGHRVRLYVEAEATGVLRLTKGGPVVETEEEVRYAPRTTTRRPDTVKRTWRLDLSGLNLGDADLKKLDGRAVAVAGRAELRWVIAGLNADPDKGDAMTLEGKRLIQVRTLKPAGK